MTWANDVERWGIWAGVIISVTLAVGGFIVSSTHDTAAIQTRLSGLEAKVDVIQQIQNQNTEARIRQEEDLKVIQANQDELKRMMREHMEHK